MIEHPELFEDSDIEYFVNLIYEKCGGAEADCEHCPHYNELDDTACTVDILMDLWRKWRNLK